MTTRAEMKKYFTKLYGERKATAIMKAADKRKAYMKKHGSYV